MFLLTYTKCIGVALMLIKVFHAAKKWEKNVGMGEGFQVIEM